MATFNRTRHGLVVRKTMQKRFGHEFVVLASIELQLFLNDAVLNNIYDLNLLLVRGE